MKFATLLDLGLRLMPPYILMACTGEINASIYFDGLHRGTVILPSLVHCYFSREICISIVVGLTCP